MARQDIEIDEALAAVDEALERLGAAAEDLRKASNWGWFDMFGGGTFVSWIKHSKMATAQEHLSAAQAALTRLSDELDDVQGFAGIGPDVGDFLLAADWLFDNVFMDAMVQRRIAESQDRVTQAIAQCESVREQLLALKRPARGANNGLPSGE